MPSTHNVKLSHTWKVALISDTPLLKATIMIASTKRVLPHSPPQIQPTTMHIHGLFLHPPTKNYGGNIEGSISGFGIYNPNNNIHISKKLPNYENILQVGLYATLIAIKTIQTTRLSIYIFTYSLNNHNNSNQQPN